MTTTRPTPAQILQRCIARCTRSRDGRGRWRAERDCTAELGGRPLDARCAGAARRIGRRLRRLIRVIGRLPRLGDEKNRPGRPRRDHPEERACPPEHPEHHGERPARAE